MNKNIRFIVAIVVIILSNQSNLLAQSLQVGAVTEDYYRRAQLLGKADTNVSFTVRPIFPKLSETQPLDTFFPDPNEVREPSTDGHWKSAGGKLTIDALPISINTQINSHHPYGWNDGPMIPAKGFQTVISGGIFAKQGIVTVQFKPEIIAAVNSPFDNLNNKQSEIIFARYYDVYNNIDLPMRFGNDLYGKIYWGQSSIRLNFKALSAGISTENLWWGPGIRNSLLMSNNAPGFPHLTLNTSRPVKTSIGSFEGQLISGKLSNSNYAPLTPDKYYFGNNLYVPKPDNWRFITGAIVTWQPKWVPGLFLGVSQVQQMYGNNVSGITDYLPLFLPFSSNSAPDEALRKKDQITSGFMRWLWTKEHAEVYFEFGHYNNSKNLTQSFLSPNTSRAYTFGLRKMIPFGKATDENILIGVEVTQLQENSVAKVRAGNEWYVSKSIRQGYTNYGQVLGAGIGPGGNIQSLNVSWVKGLKRLGIQLERYVHDNDVYYYIFYDSGDYSRHWVDLSAAVSGEWNYKNFIFSGKLQAINSLNYQWYTKVPNDILFNNGVNAFNFHMQLGAIYRF
ncbi:capsule assembly Wzi family protein [Mucilaginibacter auburnensis]|uniref:Capsule assembly protein Wzi n=1 Tax=Mucilaginibacter auburnensis TaxID=1457233 RepID=A0A2H9VTB7_9SPHI|nr:capsule assembly Wzi family protein [Mucilaginibacter auburnensis]PJJ84061.1 capsule assembly protein Wzi [Mucilaginibacter auburnensis]